MVSALHDCLDRAPTLSSIKRQAEVLSVPSLHSLRHVTSFTKRMAKHIERAGVLRRLWTAYCHQLVERPILTRACTSATGLSTSQRTSIQRRRVGMALGDAVAQVLTVPGPFELQRTMTFGCFGFFFHGPALYYFYRALDQVTLHNSPYTLLHNCCLECLPSATETVRWQCGVTSACRLFI